MKLTAKQQQAEDVADQVYEKFFSERKIKFWVKSRGVPTRIYDVFYQGAASKYLLLPRMCGYQATMAERCAFLRRLTRRAGAMLPVVSDFMSMAVLSTMRDLSQREIIGNMTMRGRQRPAFSLAFTESNVAGRSTEVAAAVSERDGVPYLNGVKTFVTSGQFMPETLVIANDPVRGAQDGGTSFWLVPIDAPGVSTMPINSLGFEMLDPASVSFEDVRLDERWRIQTEGRFHEMLDRQMKLCRLYVCAACTGLAEAALDDVVAFVKNHPGMRGQRSYGKGSTGRVAAMESRVQAMRLMLNDAAASMDEGAISTADMASVKMFVCNAAVSVSEYAMETVGYASYTDDMRIGRIWRDCAGCRITLGGNEAMSHIIFRRLVEKGA